MPITEINSTTTRALATEAEVILKALASRYGLSVRYTGGSYTSSNATLKFEFAVVGENGKVSTREAEAFRNLATLYGLKPDDLGKTFTSQGRVFQLTGLKPDSPKFPFIGKRIPDGKEFKFTRNIVSKLNPPPPTGNSMIDAIDNNWPS